MELNELRSEIDAVDSQIIAQLSKRASLVSAAGRLKKNEQGVRDPKRVEQIIEKVRAQAIKAGLAPELAEEVYRTIIGCFVRMELKAFDMAVTEGRMKGSAMNQSEFEISTDKKRLDFGVIHDFLSTRSYWANGISREVLKKSIGNAMCFGVYHQGKQVGFARVITDNATTAYIGDVFILESYRGRGLGKLLVKTIVGHLELQDLRLWLLGTKDAHGLYEKVGFKRTADTHAADRFMMLFDPDAYTRKTSH